MTVHDLLLGLAGRVDDDLLDWARELVASGDDARAVELVTAALVADTAALPAAVRADLVDAARTTRCVLDPDAGLPPAAAPHGTAPDTTTHTFDPPRAGEDTARIAATVRRLLDGRGRAYLALRRTPAGAAPRPGPRAVVLVEVAEVVSVAGVAGGAPLAHRLGAALADAGVPASVEVLAEDAVPSAYHAAARRAGWPLGEDVAEAVRGTAPSGLRRAVRPAAPAVQAGPVGGRLAAGAALLSVAGLSGLVRTGPGGGRSADDDDTDDDDEGGAGSLTGGTVGSAADGATPGPADGARPEAGGRRSTHSTDTPRRRAVGVPPGSTATRGGTGGPDDDTHGDPDDGTDDATDDATPGTPGEALGGAPHTTRGDTSGSGPVGPVGPVGGATPGGAASGTSDGGAPRTGGGSPGTADGAAPGRPAQAPQLPRRTARDAETAAAELPRRAGKGRDLPRPSGPLRPASTAGGSALFTPADPADPKPASRVPLAGLGRLRLTRTLPAGGGMAAVFAGPASAGDGNGAAPDDVPGDAPAGGAPVAGPDGDRAGDGGPHAEIATPADIAGSAVGGATSDATLVDTDPDATGSGLLGVPSAATPPFPGGEDDGAPTPPRLLLSGEPLPRRGSATHAAHRLGEPEDAGRPWWVDGAPPVRPTGGRRHRLVEDDEDTDGADDTEDTDDAEDTDGALVDATVGATVDTAVDTAVAPADAGTTHSPAGPPLTLVDGTDRAADRAADSAADSADRTDDTDRTEDDRAGDPRTAGTGSGDLAASVEAPPPGTGRAPDGGLRPRPFAAPRPRVVRPEADPLSAPLTGMLMDPLLDPTGTTAPAPGQATVSPFGPGPRRPGGRRRLREPVPDPEEARTGTLPEIPADGAGFAAAASAPPGDGSVPRGGRSDGGPEPDPADRDGHRAVEHVRGPDHVPGRRTDPAAEHRTAGQIGHTGPAAQHRPTGSPDPTEPAEHGAGPVPFPAAPAPLPAAALSAAPLPPAPVGPARAPSPRPNRHRLGPASAGPPAEGEWTGPARPGAVAPFPSPRAGGSHPAPVPRRGPGPQLDGGPLPVRDPRPGGLRPVPPPPGPPWRPAPHPGGTGPHDEQRPGGEVVAFPPAPGAWAPADTGQLFDSDDAPTNGHAPDAVHPADATDGEPAREAPRPSPGPRAVQQPTTGASPVPRPSPRPSPRPHGEPAVVDPRLGISSESMERMSPTDRALLAQLQSELGLRPPGRARPGSPAGPRPVPTDPPDIAG